jgi:hypothetical protein
MSKKILQLVLMVLFVVAARVQVFGQDTLDVPAFFASSGDPALVNFILGDTLDGGARANPNRVYRLGRDSIYIMNGQLRVDFNLKLIADDDPTGTSRPPIVIRGKYADGTNVKDPIVFTGNDLDVHFKNIIFTGFDLDRKAGDWTGPLKFASDNIHATVEKCVFNQWDWVIYSTGNHNKIFIKDCVFRNNNINWHPFVGQQFYCGGVPLDTLEITNTTYFNDNAFIVGLENNITKYFRFEHNTVMTTMVDPIRVRYLTNAKIVSNIFYGTHAMGETDYERNAGWYTSHGKHASTIDLDTVAANLMQNAGLTETDRQVLVKGNVYFWPQKIKDFWASLDSVNGIVWMNDPTKAMFDDDTNYPHLVAEGNIEADPQFTDNTMLDWVVNAVVEYAQDFRTHKSAPLRNYDAYVNNGEMLQLKWPLPESMVYSNQTVMTAGCDGFPAGDLNWYPEKKKEWEDSQTGIRKDELGTLPENYKLSQNYPNPFNPTTVIEFSLPKSGVATLEVFNILGQKIATLVNEKLSAGNYRFDFNAKNIPSGVYLYKLNVNNFTAIRKMMLLK